MKIIVISDSHGNIANLKHVMGFAKKLKVGAVIHCGDWNTIESVETVLLHKIPLYSVIGNADIDEDIDQKLKIKSQNYNSKFLIIKLGGRTIGVTHEPSDNKKYFLGQKLNIIFDGHLHSRFESEWNGIKIVRPGAIVNGINFAVYDTETGKIDFVNEQD